MVPIYLYGTGAESINGVMENAELGAKLKSLIGD
jgi:alkaline phosphatase